MEVGILTQQHANRSGLIPFPPIIDKSSVYPVGVYLAFQLGLKINAFTAAD